MKCIYEVRYEVKWHSAEPTHWEAHTVRVFSDANALEAVEKARKTSLAQRRLDENGQEEHCTDFRLREVILIAEAQL